jgi:hypothetical protein
MANSEDTPLNIHSLWKNGNRYRVTMFLVKHIGNVIEGKRGGWMIPTKHAATFREHFPL